MVTVMDTQDLREYDAACRLRFDFFYQRCFLTLNPGQEFKDNWSIDAMAHFATRFINGEFRRGIVNMPPRHGKSQMFNVALCAFILGHDPRKRIFCIGYAGPLASEHATMFKDIVESAWYQRLFPRMQIKRSVDNDIYTTKRGYRRWTSVAGSMTGMGGDIFIVDDPIKPIDVKTPAQRGKVNEWLRHTLLQRLDDKEKGQVLLVMQRLHIDDPAGFILRNFEGWDHLCLPAIAEMPQNIEIGRGRIYKRQVGEVLNPARESLATVERLRIENGPIVFAAHQQQDPVPEGGAMLPTDLYQFYTDLPERDPQSFVIQSWDCAAKTGFANSFSVCTTWLLHQQCFYLMHVFRKRMLFHELAAAAETLEGQFKPRYILIEDASSGTSLGQVLKLKFGSGIRLVKAELNKELRLFEQTLKFYQGRVFFPTEAPWLRLFLEELRIFPEGGLSDQVDSITQALNFKMPYDPGNITRALSGMTDSYWARRAFLMSRGY
jgi:predicted phage terminase large subunit-like protein